MPRRPDSEPKLLKTVETPVVVQVYEAIEPLREQVKDLNADIKDHKARLKEEGHQVPNFAYCQRAMKLEPTAQAERLRDLLIQWRALNLSDPTTDDLIERNLHAVTTGNNGELHDEPDVEEEIPLPSATPPENAYRERMLKRARKSSDTPVN